MSASLFLKVAWPQKRELTRRQVEVAGKTAPGAHLTVGGVAVPVGKDGRFRGVITLREGANAVSVVAHDVGGHAAASDARLLLDTTAPPLSTEKLPWEKK